MKFNGSVSDPVERLVRHAVSYISKGFQFYLFLRAPMEFSQCRQRALP
jgi:hypothetical protein